MSVRGLKYVTGCLQLSAPDCHSSLRSSTISIDISSSEMLWRLPTLGESGDTGDTTSMVIDSSDDTSCSWLETLIICFDFTGVDVLGPGLTYCVWLALWQVLSTVLSTVSDDSGPEQLASSLEPHLTNGAIIWYTIFWTLIKPD